MSTLALPARPNLEHLKKQARSLLSERDPARFAAFGIEPASARLSDALHVLAQEYGFATWPALKLHVELQSEDGITALIAAIKADNAEAVAGVLARHPTLKAGINEPLPNYGFDEPALLAAVHQQNRAMVDALLDFGANINERSRWWAGGFGVLDFATPELSQHLISRGAQLDIHSAARLGMLEQVRQLLAADPTLIHARGGDGQFPLHFAATADIAEALLAAGAELDVKDIDHESTALQYMASTKPERHDVARYLLTRGAQADLLAASALGDLALVESILNDNPETIHLTASERSFPKQNPRAGGSIYLSGFGQAASPHMLAHQYGHTAVWDLLMQRSAPSHRLVQAAELGDEALAARIVERYPGVVQTVNELSARRIIGPAVRNNTAAVELLLHYGWPAGPVMESGLTALHFAAFHGNVAMAKALVAHGAAVNVYEKEHGGSPLGWALHGSLHGWHRAQGDYPGVVRALLKAGANLPQTGRPVEAADDVLSVLNSQSR